MDWYLTLSTVTTAAAGGTWLIVNVLKEHDWRKCSCSKCTERRERAWQHQRAGIYKANISYVSRGSNHTSTARLTAGMYVGLNGTRYYVREVRTDAMGYLVGLTNLETGNRLVSTVSFEKADQRYWEPL